MSVRIIVEDENGHFLLGYGSRSILEPQGISWNDDRGCDSINFGPNNEIPLELLINMIYEKISSYQPTYGFNLVELKKKFTSEQLSSSLFTLAGINVWDWIKTNLIPKLLDVPENGGMLKSNEIHFINDDNKGIKFRVKAFKVHIIGGQKNAGEHPLLGGLREFKEEIGYSFPLLASLSEDKNDRIEKLKTEILELNKQKSENKIKRKINIYNIKNKLKKIKEDLDILNYGKIIPNRKILDSTESTKTQKENATINLEKYRKIRDAAEIEYFSLKNKLEILESPRVISEEDEKITVLSRRIKEKKNELKKLIPGINYSVPPLPTLSMQEVDTLYCVKFNIEGESLYYIKVSNGKLILDSYDGHSLNSEIFDLLFVNPDTTEDGRLRGKLDEINEILGEKTLESGERLSGKKRSRNMKDKQKYLKYKAKYLALKKLMDKININ